MKELRARVDELEAENQRIASERDYFKQERQRYLDACTAGALHAGGVERWIEDMGNMFVRLASEGIEPRNAIERWISTMSDAFGRLANEGVEHRQALNGWIGATVALSGQRPE